MPREITFGKQKIIEPGAYSQIKSGIKNPPLNLSYGNVLIIDTGSGAGYGSGSGVSGTHIADKAQAIQSFDNLKDYRFAMKGGILWLIGKWLYQPKNFAVAGASNVRYIRACTTVSAELSYTFTGGGANGGILIVQPVDEGLVANGRGRVSDETASEATITVTGAGVAAETIEITSDEGGAAPVSLGVTTVPGTPTVNSVASAIATEINLHHATHGYTAEATNAAVTITAPDGVGTGAHTYTLAAVKSLNATVTVTLTSFAGGVNGTLVKGFGSKMKVSPTDAAKYMIDYYVGTYRGLDADGESYDFKTEDQSDPELLISSEEFDNIEELYDWARLDATFLKYFKIHSYSKTGTGVVDAADLTANAGWTFATGGTEVYGAGDLTNVLEAIVELDYTFILADKWGTDCMHATLTTLLDHIYNDSKYGSFLVVGGGNTAATFTSKSIAATAFYNSDKVILVHAGLKKNRADGTGFKEYPSIVKAAAVLGRIAGLPPQVPVTFKGIDMDADSHSMTTAERKIALKKGVLHTKFDYEFNEFTINQGLTTIQNNVNMVNEDGTSCEIQIMRIAAQLNKEIAYNAKIQLFGGELKANRNTLSKNDVKNFVEGYLQRRCATDVVDNLILNYQSVVVDVVQDSYYITYGFVPNFPVNKLFFTGYMLDPETN